MTDLDIVSRLPQDERVLHPHDLLRQHPALREESLEEGDLRCARRMRDVDGRARLKEPIDRSERAAEQALKTRRVVSLDAKRALGLADI